MLQCLGVMSGCVCNGVMQLLCCSVWVSCQVVYVMVSCNCCAAVFGCRDKSNTYRRANSVHVRAQRVLRCVLTSLSVTALL